MPVRASHPRRGVAVPLIAALALTALLSLTSAAYAVKAPPLAATAQYKAFVDYVKKLDGRAGQPTSAAQKDKYEAELTAKRAAAAHKANALFKRVSEEAKAEYDAKFKEQAAIVRGVEDDELEAVAADYAAKIDRASASYQLEAGQHRPRPPDLRSDAARTDRRPASPEGPNPRRRAKNRDPRADHRPDRPDQRQTPGADPEARRPQGRLPRAEAAAPIRPGRARNRDRRRRRGQNRQDREALENRLRGQESDPQLKARKPARLPRSQARKRPRRHRLDADGGLRPVG